MVILDADEQIVAMVRRHWFAMLRVTLGSILVALLPLILWAVFRMINVIPELSLRTEEMMLFFYVIFLIFVWMFYFLEWTDYYLDVWLVTNKRVIDIEQKGLFRREIISLHHDRIQDVTVITSGVIATLLNFGKVHVQTAGERRKIILHDAPDPEEVKRMILSRVPPHRYMSM
ncbi:MAG: hypothetical protein COV34_02475 [Candidatus Zambryskibacteria bacterium CG10_big_fil_rev_8_21_14_0_10_42_12]|uniref:YdbS-like PH domain-containing protein n=1 Tax=Candidatus Zambryskibacteria bacterium CG10_big_fil_rev_8_21_14_0_10_42_12 TaxID=1975115 RepID=A0A2H0QUH7_9BACT|nr:MAG: hypothetical protein COV34_02475 [Candidatus Zambryskibacteria bacterium CG10_big_fil_rev_8_21_14_0_10_42_12]